MRTSFGSRLSVVITGAEAMSAEKELQRQNESLAVTPYPLREWRKAQLNVPEGRLLAVCVRRSQGGLRQKVE